MIQPNERQINRRVGHSSLSLIINELVNKKQILAYQASKRGGYLYCELREDGRINVSGKAALVGIADIVAFPDHKGNATASE